MEPSPPAAPAPAPPGAAPAPVPDVLVEARGLTKRFGPVRAVEGVSFRVARGELVGFLGPNGAGKSTTMRMLTGYLVPDAGEARVAGLGVQRVEARARVGYLPEHTPLYREMRVDRYLEHVARLRGVGRGAPRRDALERVVTACDLDGYTTRRIRTLSKGYRQRVGLAQALVADPDVLILDEPTSGLDPGEIVRIRDLVVRLAREKTVLLSTHVLPEVEEVCRRVLILAGGRLVADGGLLELAEGEGERLVVVVAGDETRVTALLSAPEGVREVRPVGRGLAGRVRYELLVEDRFAVAERVARALHDGGHVPLELRHEVPTLEHVFLSRTRGLARAAQGGNA